ncbi:hypothetical protein [Pusillimonas sp.]|uniref:hypothetical protein n=1 Tax=Pusillimonas sp. TaxID=3040095 RepID=UPI0037CC09A1
MSSDADFADLVRFLSLERLATFQAITGSIGEAISLHQQTLRLGSQLMMVTAVIEVALRNAVYEKLESYYGQPDWLVTPPAGLAWRSSEVSKIQLAKKSARRDVYAKMSQAQKRHLDTLAFPRGVPVAVGKAADLRRVAARQEQISVTMGQIVAQLTFFFWKRLYSKDYANVLWTPLKTVFPDRNLKRPDVASQLEHLYQSRNRVAHHEPIFGRRLQETLGAIEFFLNYFDGKDANGVAHISKLLAEDFKHLKASASELESRIASFKVSGGG